MAETMRAARMLGVNEIVCEEAAVPDIGADEILVHTSMASICGSDLHVVCHGAGIGHELPCPHGYPGHEGIGEVVASNHDRVAVGTRVLCFPVPGADVGFAEYQRMNGSFVLPLPESDRPEPHLLMAQQLGTVIFAARQRPRDVTGETVVVLGQGSAGLFWAYVMKRSGAARVIVADKSDTRLAVSESFGADITINAGESDTVEAVKDLTDGVGADYVIEAVGRRETLFQSIEVARVGGQMMWFGLPDSDDSVPISFSKFFRKKLMASSTYGAQVEGDAVSFQTALDWINAGEVDVSPLLSHVYPIEEISHAFDVANEPAEEGALKVSVTF
ncbi:MAG: zinc-binding dehydrogenase [Actinomycetia bacterium]|nr:zinc-binding dehydrogenase [Actinomycetes bacterium]